MRGVLLLPLLIASPACAEWDIWSTKDAEALLDCAAVIERFEVKEGEELPTDFKAASAALQADVMVWHGTSFVKRTMRSRRSYWENALLHQKDAEHLRKLIPECQKWVVARGF